MRRTEAHERMIDLLLKHTADLFAVLGDGYTVLQTIIEKHGNLNLFLHLPGFATDLKGFGGRTPMISSCYPNLTPEPQV